MIEYPGDPSTSSSKPASRRIFNAHRAAGVQIHSQAASGIRRSTPAGSINSRGMSAISEIRSKETCNSHVPKTQMRATPRVFADTCRCSTSFLRHDRDGPAWLTLDGGQALVALQRDPAFPYLDRAHLVLRMQGIVLMSQTAQGALVGRGCCVPLA